MVLRWTMEAAADLERIADYLFDQTPTHAQRIVRAIYGAPDELLRFPNSGRVGKMSGTRELLVSSLPYQIVYRVSGETIYIARILHGAQKWPI